MIAWTLLAVLISSSPQAAPRPPSDPLERALYQQLANGLPKAAVGQWVTYALHGTDRPFESFWRLAIVGKEKDAKGRDAVWLEMELAQHANFVAPLFQMKMLVASKGGLQADGITRAIMAVGAGQPQEVDPASLASPKTPRSAPDGEQAMTVDGQRVTIRAGKRGHLMTVAGTVDATPVEIVYRQTVLERFWISKEIPVLQLAKIEIPNLADSMEVRDYGLNAKPMIHFPDPNAPTISLETTPDPDGGTDAPPHSP